MSLFSEMTEIDRRRPALGPPRALSALAWLPLALLPLASAWPRWALMWVVAAAIFFGCKWLTWREHLVLRREPWPRSLAYLLLWPGMDARAFFDDTRPSGDPAPRQWGSAVVVTLFGGSILWGAARWVPPNHLLLRGWIGMIGLILLLHFGTFRLLAFAWQSAGIRAEPIMRFPIAARTLSEFWSLRWNRGFNDLAHRYLFRPLQARLGPAAATMLTFLASGLLHELVISLPAVGGYGLPTAYFLLQGAGILAQRSPAGKRAGLARGIRGRLFTLLATAVPAFWLFHPLFVERVIIPFFTVIGAL